MKAKQPECPEFGYFFRGKPQALAELNKLGITLQAVNVDELGEELWPALVLPSGTVLLIMRDDEGNGAGSLDVIPARPDET